MIVMMLLVMYEAASDLKCTQICILEAADIPIPWPFSAEVNGYGNLESRACPGNPC